MFCCGMQTHTGDLLDGYTAINETDEGTAGSGKDASIQSRQQIEGRIVSGARSTASATANRRKPSETRTYHAQKADPDRCVQRKGRDLDDQARLDDRVIAGNRDPQAPCRVGGL